jgi:hypothetical protein
VRVARQSAPAPSRFCVSAPRHCVREVMVVARAWVGAGGETQAHVTGQQSRADKTTHQVTCVSLRSRSMELALSFDERERERAKN